MTQSFPFFSPKTLIKTVLFLLVLDLSSCNLAGREASRDALLTRLVLERLDDWHYLKLPIDDKFSKEIYKSYLSRLDFEKKILLQSDLEQLKGFETAIDNELLEGRLDFYNKVQEIYSKRLQEAKPNYEEVLAKPILFSVKESIETDPE
ncbi:MAG: hypothetical protein JNM63_06305, partial [Spirochaetia bacterium]|nr:hypothetical protein [Spirochaetia bacterium]